MACLALGVAVLELLPGCASTQRGAPGAELNPVVTARPKFMGHAVPMVTFDLEVEQTDPMIIRPHTWTVNVWSSVSNSADVSPGRVAWIMEEPPQACHPDHWAGTEESEFKYWRMDHPLTGKYVILVVEVVEMTGGERSQVYATKTYAAAFKNWGHYPKDVVIPLCTDAGVSIAAGEGGAEVRMQGAGSY